MTRVSSFAYALYSLAFDANKVKDIFRQVQTLLTQLDVHPEIIATLNSEALMQQEKADFITQALRPFFDPLLCDFLRVVADMHEFYAVKKILRRYLATVQEVEHSRFVRVVSPFALTDADLERIRVVLANKTGENVIVQNKVDPDVIGGFRLETERRTFDWSINGKIDAIRRDLQTAHATAKNDKE